MTKLNERAMLASLHVGVWTGMSIDREVSEEVSTNHKAEQDAGRYSKRLISPKFLRGVSSKVNAARQTHRLLTLPWDDDGTRILSTTGYQHYTEMMRMQRLTVEAAIAEFCDSIPEYITEAKIRLGTMFNREDYPEPAVIRKKFYVDVEIKPIPEAGDFRAKLSDASVKAIVKDIEDRSNARIETAMQDVFGRIKDVTEKMVERLRAYKPGGNNGKAENIFHDTLVTNVLELADLLPALNITGDPRLDALQKQLREDLVEHSPEVLRSDSKARSKTADKAERILKKVNSYLA